MATVQTIHVVASEDDALQLYKDKKIPWDECQRLVNKFNAKSTPPVETADTVLAAFKAGQLDAEATKKKLTVLLAPVVKPQPFTLHIPAAIAALSKEFKDIATQLVLHINVEGGVIKLNDTFERFKNTLKEVRIVDYVLSRKPEVQDALDRYFTGNVVQKDVVQKEFDYVHLAQLTFILYIADV